jgi:hypothetical protein
MTIRSSLLLAPPRLAQRKEVSRFCHPTLVFSQSLATCYGRWSESWLQEGARESRSFDPRTTTHHAICQGIVRDGHDTCDSRSQACTTELGSRPMVPVPRTSPPPPPPRQTISRAPCAFCPTITGQPVLSSAPVKLVIEMREVSRERSGSWSHPCAVLPRSVADGPREECDRAGTRRGRSARPGDGNRQVLVTEDTVRIRNWKVDATHNSTLLSRPAWMMAPSCTIYQQRDVGVCEPPIARQPSPPLPWETAE